jgi:AraC-like DNA-binding protein
MATADTVAESSYHSPAITSIWQQGDVVRAPPYDRRMLAERAPHDAVRPLLTRSYVGFHQPAGTAVRWLSPPTGTATVILNIGAPFGGLPAAFAAGLTDRHEIIEQSGTIDCVDLKLTPLGAYTLLGSRMDELTGVSVDLTDLLGAPARRLTEQLAATTDWTARFDLLDAFLADRADRGRHPAPEVAWAWRRLTATAGLVPVGELAAEVGWSRRHLVARFREQVGLPPKTLARICRFSRLTGLVTDGARWAELAAECGYYDQAHMNRDFREFAGITPTEYLARLSPVEVTSVQYSWVAAP